GLLELALGRLVVRIAVGMVFHRELPIGLLQVIGGRVLRYPEYIVEVTLGHRPIHAIRSSSRPFESIGDRRLATPAARWVNARRRRAGGPVSHADQESRLTSRKSASTTSSPLAWRVSSAGCSGAGPVLSCCAA